jgi:hypothetical protein
MFKSFKFLFLVLTILNTAAFAFSMNGTDRRHKSTQSCDTLVETVFLAGTEDQFNTPTEPASPSADLLNFYGQGNMRDFDAEVTNFHMGHTFTNLPMGVVGAILEIGVKADSGDVTTNDSLNLDFHGQAFSWSSSLADLSTSGTWTPGTQEVITLDLCALPTANGPFDLLPRLASLCLDVLVSDDTAVDFIRLTLTHCPSLACGDTVTEDFTGGESDMFAGATEPSSRSQDLADAVALVWPNVNPLDFDECTADRPFAHTFTGLPACIIDAQLEMGLMSISSLGSNDTLNINYRYDGGAYSPTWAFAIPTLTGLNWASGEKATLKLNLRNLPASVSSGVTDALGPVTGSSLDVVIQDDTCVDYMKLTVTTCEEEGGLLLYSWVSNNAGQYTSVVAVDNPSNQPVNLLLTACRPDGSSETTARGIPPKGALQESGASLFPNLGSGPGYAVLVKASSADVQGGWVTGSLTATSGFSPAQGVAVHVPQNVADLQERAGLDIIYNYMPEDNNTLSAVVLVNLGLNTTDVDLAVYDRSGNLHGTTTETDLSPFCPRTVLVSSLAPSPGAYYVLASASREPITGTGFVFDTTFGEPAIGNVSRISAQPFCTSPLKDTLAWFPLDEDTGTTAQELIEGSNGAHIDAPTPVSGFVNGALSFSGTGDHVEAPNAGNLNFGTRDFSIEVWFRTSQTAGVVTLLDKRANPNQGYSLYVFNGSPGLQLASGGAHNNFNSSLFVSDNEWHHLVVSVDRDDPMGLVFRVDGTLQEDFNPTASNGDLDNTAPLRIGGHSFSPPDFIGELDEVTFYGHALSEAEISYLFQAGPNGKCR